MNHWLILLLTIVAMWAIVLVFMWWWTTEKWDLASAELKPPRTVSQKPPVNHLTEWMRIQEDYNKLMHQRVTNAWGALENLEQRVTALEKEMGALNFRVGSLELVTPLPSSASPSRATESHIKGDPLGVERVSTTLPTLRFSQSGHPTTGAGLAGNVSGSVEVEDVSK